MSIWTRLRYALAGRLALRNAARRGDLARVDQLLAIGFRPLESVWERGFGFERSLESAVEHGHLAVAQRLAQAGGWLAGDDFNRGPLIDRRGDLLTRAVRCRHIEIVRWLISEAARPKIGHLEAAVTQNNTELVQFLSRAKQLPTEWSQQERHALDRMFVSAAGRGNIKVMEAIESLGVSLSANNHHSYDQYQAAHSAAAAGDVHLLEYLARRGAPLDDAPLNQITPLVVAAEKGSLEAARFLLAHGARPNPHTSALTRAVANGHRDLAVLLIEHGAEVNYLRGEVSPLGRAIERGDAELVRCLIEHGVDCTHEFDIYRGDDDHQTWYVNYVEWAEHCRKPEIAELLARLGAPASRAQLRRR